MMTDVVLESVKGCREKRLMVVWKECSPGGGGRQAKWTRSCEQLRLIKDGDGVCQGETAALPLPEFLQMLIM